MKFSAFVCVAILLGSAFANAQQTKYIIGTSESATHRINDLNDVASTYQMFRNALGMMKSGGTLEIEAGTYIFTDTVKLPKGSGFTIKGAGKNLTILKLADEAPMTSGKIGLLNIESVDGLTLQDFSLDGNSAKQTAVLPKETRSGVYCTGCSKVVVASVDAYGWRGNGFFMQPKSSTPSSSVSFDNSFAVGNDFDGFNFKSVSDIAITGSGSFGNGGDGFSFSGCSKVSLTSVTTKNNHRHGVYADLKTTGLTITKLESSSDGHGVDVVSGAPFEGCGVFLKGAQSNGSLDGVTVTESNIANSNMSAVFAEAVNNLTVEKSNLTGNVYCVKVTYTSGTVSNSNCYATKGIPPSDPTSPSFTVSGVNFSPTGSVYTPPPPMDLLIRPPTDGTVTDGTVPDVPSTNTTTDGTNTTDPTTPPPPQNGAGSSKMNFGAMVVAGVLAIKMFV
jgi:hypothetical protein